MANVKRITLDWSETGITVYYIARREIDNYRMDDADGDFAAAPADPYQELSEDAVIKSRYEADESRVAWDNGRYTFTFYKQAGGSPVPASDTVIGTGELDIANDIEVFNVNITRIGGDTTAANNLELQYDTTGLVGDTFPSTQSQVGNIGSATGGGFSFESIGDNTGGAIKGIPFVGVETSGTYADTEANDGSYHQIDDTGNTIDIIYQFNIGSDRVATEITFKGYLSGNNDTALIQAYDFIGSSWETRETIVGQNGSSNNTITPKLLSKHTGIGSDSGLVLIRVLASAQSNPALFTDEFLVQANALATGIPNGSTITLDTATPNETFIGYAWNLVLNGQTITGSYFANAVSVSGTGVIVNGSPAILSGSKIEVCTLSAYLIMGRCILSNTLTIVSTAGGVDDEVDLFNCASGKKGAASPTIDASGVTKTTGIQNRLYGGGCTYSINSFCTLSHESIVSGTITLTNAGGTAELRGNVKAFVVTSSGTATTNIVCTSGVPITINGTGGTVNIYGTHAGITDNSSGTVTINDNGADVTNKTGYSLSATGLDAISQAATGMIEIAKAIMDRVLTGGTHNIVDSLGRRIRNQQELGTYEGGHVYIDTVNGQAGTTDYESGTIFNPVDSITDANTVVLSLNLTGFHVAPLSAVTFIASQNGQTFRGDNWSLDLGGQSISGTHIRGAEVTGICSGASNPEFHECNINSVTIPPSEFVESDLEGTITLPVGEVEFHHCAGETGFVLDYGVAVANTTVLMTDFSGDLTIENLGANGTDILSVRGHGKLTLAASCVGGTINWDGHFTIVNNGSGITINADDITTTALAILADTNELQTDITNGGRIDLILDELTTQGDTNETKIDNIILTGARTITIQLYETATTTPIADVAVSIYNSDQSLFLGRKITNSNGQIVIGRDDGTYKLVFTKAGVTFSVPETLTVIADATHTYYGDTFIISAPVDADVCRVYDYLFEADGVTIPTTVDAEARIQVLPYSADGKLHIGSIINEVYDNVTGLIYWDIIKGASVKFDVTNFINTSKIIPDTATARLYDIA